MMQLSIKQKVNLGFTGMFLILAVVGLISYQNTTRFEQEAGLVSHTYQVLEQLKSLPSALKETHRGVRGYVITGEKPSLEPYYDSVEKIYREVNALGIMTADNPVHQQRVEALRPVINDALAALKEIVEARGNRGFEAAAELVRQGVASSPIDQAQHIIRVMEDEEYRLLKLRSDQASASAWRNRIAILAGNAIALVFILVAGWLINRNIAEQKELDKQMRELNFALTHALEAIAQCDEQRRYMTMNPAYARILGCQPEEMIGLEWPQMTHPEDAETLLAAYEQMRRLGRAEIEARKLRFDGSIVYTEIVLVANYDETGNLAGHYCFMKDISARKQTERELRLVVEASPSDMMMVDAKGCIELVNTKLEKIFGYQREDLLGQQMSILLPERFRSQHGRLQTEFMRQPQTRAMGVGPDIYGRCKDGREIPIEVGLNPLSTTEGTFVVASIIDISERREVEKLKTQFISTVSHELRTPLTAVRGSLNLLSAGAMGTLPGEAQELIAMAERNSLRLTNLINDILDLERLENGKLQMEFAELPLMSVVDRAVETMSTIAATQGVRIHREVCADVIWADGDRLGQVLINLLSNAIKFSPRGSSITISTARAHGQVTVRVTDQGRGIPTAYHRTIFERFKQVEASDAREKGGTGLGLAICKAIIEQHEGEIGVESQEGQGSTFWFSLASVGVTPAAPPERGSLKPILVCESDLAWCRNYAAVLHQAGYDSLLASTAQGARQALSETEVSAIILDAELSDQAGLVLLDEIHRDPRLKHLPVIMLGEQPVLTPDQISAKLSAFLLKPINGDQLLQAVRSGLRKNHRCEMLLVDDDSELLELMKRLMEMEHITIQTASTGRQAIEQVLKRPPGLIVLDVGMPDGDGFEVIEALRAVKDYQRIPLLVYTGQDLTSGQRRRLKLGPTVFLTKSKVTDKEFRSLAVNLLHCEQPWPNHQSQVVSS